MNDFQKDDSSEKRQSRKTVLVAGGAHFLGSHLSEALLVQGFKVICLDDFSLISGDYLGNCKKDKNFSIVNFSLDKSEELKKVGKINYLFHVAGLDLPPKGEPLNSLLINSQGTKLLLQKAQQDKANFLFVSLVDIYSGVASRLSLENYFGQNEDEEKQLALFEAKRFGEALVEEFWRKEGIKARIVRVRDIYGPKMPLKSLFSLNRLFGLFIESRKISLPGDGLEEVYPTYISDVVYGLIKAMFSTQTEGKVYYLVNPHKTTLRAVAETLLSFYKEGGAIDFTPTEKITLPLPSVDISLSKKELRWFPIVSLEEGVEKTLFWFSKEIKFKQEKSLKEIQESKDFSKKDYRYLKTEIGGETQKEGTEAGGIDTLIPGEIETKEELTTPKKTASSKGLLNTIFHYSPKERKTKPPKEKKVIVAGELDTKLHRHFNKLKGGFVLLCLIFIIFGFLSPLFFSSFFALRGISAIERAKTALTEFSFATVSSEAAVAEKSFRTAGNGLNNLLWFFSFFHERKRFQQYLYLLSAGKDLAEGVKYIGASVEPLLSSIDTFLDHNQTQSNIDKIVPLVRADIVQAKEKFSQAEAKLDILESQYYPQNLWNKVVIVQTQLKEGKQILSSLETLVNILPSIMGKEEDKAYLIVFQNNSEMRATGGFIGSYARILVSQGKIKEIKVDDVYNPDGLIKEPQIPPEPLKKYLSVTNWGMRDANWSPDFSVASTDIERLYEQATQDDVSGIIAIDLYTVEKLIEKIGPIYPLGYNDEITAENFFAKAEYYAAVGFTPGSTGKKDFLGACAEALLAKLQNMEAKDLSKIMSSLLLNVQEKHILFSFSDPQLDKLIAEQKLNGAVIDYPGDYLLVVDSNVGGNKANYFVDRAFNYDLEIDRDGNLQAVLTIKYTHRGEVDAWPGGNYRNYLRVYVPAGSTLTEFEGFSSEVKTTTDLGKNVFEGLVEVKVNSEQKVKITYNLPSGLKTIDDNLSYRFYVQKQSGSVQDLLTMNITWPSYLRLDNVSPTGERGSQSFSFTDNLNVDKEVLINFLKP